MNGRKQEMEEGREESGEKVTCSSNVNYLAVLSVVF